MAYAQAGAPVQAVAAHCVRFITSPSTATAFHKQKTYAEHAGYLAGIAYCHKQNVKTAGCEYHR
jgi:hypothetical protein